MEERPDPLADPDPPAELSTETFALHGEALAERRARWSGGLARGTAVGRYLILERLGEGGMGIVYAAHDPELDRRVALKLLRPDRADRDAALRLQREAQAVARLSHPNVVAVYDAGTFGDQVFVAMELVEGRTVRQWLAVEKPGWREIVAVFVAAGRGLAAAHAAGLAHRDFKPDNVLLGDDGRVRVVDFGLARPVGAPAEGSPEEGSPASGSVLSTPLTQWGMALGTPSYMAPEQLRGEGADARSDQFSFCVALYEALFGERPFPGGTPRELAEAVAAGALREAPAGSRVPARVRTVLVRGLGREPEKRFASMAELLDLVERDPAAARRKWLVAAALVLAAGALSGGLGYLQARRAELCGGSEEKLVGVWDAPRKQAVRAAFAKTGAPFAPDAWATVEAAFDRYASDWTRQRRQACEATQLRREQSAELLDRRMLCLDQRLQDAAALVRLFEQADLAVVTKAADSVRKLPPLGDCADTAALMAQVAPPTDPTLRKRVEAVRTVVAEARALKIAGKPAEAAPKAEEAAQAARAIGYGPLTAEAFYEYGFLRGIQGDFKGAEETLFDALVAAQAAGHQEVAARSAAQLSWVTGYEQARPAEGEKWARQAQSLAEGARGGPGLRSELLSQLSAIRAQERRFPEAVELAKRALALAERAGRDHPRIPAILNNLGQYEEQMGRHDEALRHALRALEIRKKTLPPDHPDFGSNYNTLGNIYTSLGRHQESVAAFERALEIDRKRYGSRHWLVAGSLLGLASAHQYLGHLDVALQEDEEALAIFEENFGPEHPYDAMTLVNTGEVLMLQKRPAEALASFQRALAIQEKSLGADNLDAGFSLDGINRALVALGRAAEAIPAGERAVTLFEKGAGNPAQLHTARFDLATALWEGGGERRRAERLVREARAFFEKAGDVDSRQETEDWMRQKGLVW